jgi:hypothetical protein
MKIIYVDFSKRGKELRELKKKRKQEKKEEARCGLKKRRY